MHNQGAKASLRFRQETRRSITTPAVVNRDGIVRIKPGTRAISSLDGLFPIVWLFSTYWVFAKVSEQLFREMNKNYLTP